MFWTDVASFLCSEAVRNTTVVAGVAVAIVSILAARAIARKKQSADLLFESRNDQRLQVGHNHLRAYFNSSDKNIVSLASAASSESEDAIAVRYFLNHFENVSVGIQAGIYDEKMLKKAWYTLVVNAWDHAQPLVKKLREPNRETVLQEYEWLYKRWKKSPLVKNR